MAGPATLFQSGDHASRPANGSGCVLYSCTTHDLVYVDDGTSWSTFMTLVGGAGGDIATDTIWDVAGDMVIGTGANTAGKVSIGAAGKVWQSDGSTAAWKYPPGYEFDYAQFTSPVSITATTEAGADTVVTANAVTYDGSQVVLIEFQCTYTQPTGTSALQFALFDGSSSIGLIEFSAGSAGSTGFPAQRMARRLTPSNASHTYSIRAFTGTGTATVGAGAGGSGAYMPGFIRQTKVSGGA